MVESRLNEFNFSCENRNMSITTSRRHAELAPTITDGSNSEQLIDGRLSDEGEFAPATLSETNSAGMLAFPWRLHELLEDAETKGFSNVVAWQPCGRAFKVYDHVTFANTIMSSYFNQSQYKSFQRQLNIYGFIRMKAGEYKGAYQHDSFIRGKPDLCRFMIRTKIKNKGIKSASMLTLNEKKLEGFGSMKKSDCYSLGSSKRFLSMPGRLPMFASHQNILRPGTESKPDETHRLLVGGQNERFELKDTLHDVAEVEEGLGKKKEGIRNYLSGHHRLDSRALALELLKPSSTKNTPITWWMQERKEKGHFEDVRVNNQAAVERRSASMVFFQDFLAELESADVDQVARSVSTSGRAHSPRGMAHSPRGIQKSETAGKRHHFSASRENNENLMHQQQQPHCRPTSDSDAEDDMPFDELMPDAALSPEMLNSLLTDESNDLQRSTTGSRIQLGLHDDVCMEGDCDMVRNEEDIADEIIKTFL